MIVVCVCVCVVRARAENVCVRPFKAKTSSVWISRDA